MIITSNSGKTRFPLSPELLRLILLGQLRILAAQILLGLQMTPGTIDRTVELCRYLQRKA